MVVRRRKKFNKLLGQRTRGHGDTKNWRGGGSRGGRGLAGSHKHKFNKNYGRFGKEKKKPQSRKLVKAISIDQLVQRMPKMAAEGKLGREAGLVVVDGAKIGFDKVLSTGTLKEKLLVRNMMASKRAIEKVEKAGGRFEGLPEKAEGGEEGPEGETAEEAEAQAKEEETQAEGEKEQ